MSLLNFATWSSLGGITPDAWINQQYAADTDKALGRGFVISRAYGSLQAGGYSKPNALATGPWADKRTTVHFTVDTSSNWATLSAEVGYTPGEDRHVGHQPVDRLHSSHSDGLPWQYGADAQASAESS